MAILFHAIPRARYCADGIEQEHERCEALTCPCDCHGIYAQMTVTQRLTNELETMFDDYRDVLREILLEIAQLNDEADRACLK